MALKAIIFDVDGTLAETEEAHRLAFNRAFAEDGLSWCWSERDYAALLTTTGGRERIARYMREVGLVPDPEAIAALHFRKNQLYADLIANGSVAPRPGIARLIDEARAQGINLAIATTTSRSNLDALLHSLFGGAAHGWFSAIVAGEDVVRKKPDPEVYRQVLSRLSQPAADCVAIEDSAHGVAAARSAGIVTVATPSRYTQSDSFAGAAVICEGPASACQQLAVDRLRHLLLTQDCARHRKGKDSP